MTSLPKCYFNYNTLIAKVGNSYKGYEELQCIQITPFKRKIQERESLGNGWYGGIITVEVTYDNHYIIMKNNKPYRLLINPYNKNIKSDMYPLTSNYKEVNDFINQLKAK